MTEGTFGGPQQAGQFAAGDWNGHLLVIENFFGGIQQVSTKHGVADAVVADISVITCTTSTGHGGCEEILGTNVFGNQLVKTLDLTARKSPGRPMIARLGQVPTDKGNPAWVFNDGSPEDYAYAEAWYASRPSRQLAPPAAAPVQAAVPAPAAPVAPVAAPVAPPAPPAAAVPAPVAPPAPVAAPPAPPAPVAAPAVPAAAPVPAAVAPPAPLPAAPAAPAVPAAAPAAAAVPDEAAAQAALLAQLGATPVAVPAAPPVA